MKLLYILVFLLVAMCGDHPSNNNAAANSPDEDGIFAEVLTYPEGKRFGIDVLIYLDIIEIVDGHKIHGFGKKPLEVKNPTIDENPLEIHERPANTRSYETAVDQLDRDFKLRFEMNGKKYLTVFRLSPDDLSKAKTVAVHVVNEKDDK